VMIGIDVFRPIVSYLVRPPNSWPEQLASRLGIRLESRHERILEERLDILKDRDYCLTW